VKGLIEINLGQKSDLSLKNDYPTAGWLKQSHASFMAMGWPEINAVKSASEQRVGPD
jgi:hypothetical protein